jgi:NAD+ kinase
MRHAISSVLIVTKAGNEQATDLGREVASWLEGRGVPAGVAENLPGELDGALAAACPNLVLVLGGDGTMLSVARSSLDCSVPLLGVNLGKVGFLTEISREHWQARLEQALERGVLVGERMALRFEVLRRGESVCSGQVVNDLVVNRGSLARLIDLDLAIDNVDLGLFRADGLIVATPVGSTGYLVSAGGPLVHPSLDVICVTPICAFLKDFPPLVLPGARTVRIRILESASRVFMSLDGQQGEQLERGDEIVIRRAEHGPLFAALDGNSYYARLREKGFLKESKADPEGA